MIGNLLAFPASGPIGGLVWIARQVAENVVAQMLDPARIEAALMALERRLEAGDIDEPTYEAEEALLLAELAEMRALRAEAAAATAAETGPETGTGTGTGTKTGTGAPA